MKFLFYEDVLEIHERVVTKTGGSQGVRDTHLLESIIERPKMQFGGNDLYPTIFDKAAAYFDSCAFHHVFVDGNKRTAILLVSNFLNLNGYSLKPKQGEVLDFVLSAVKNKYNLKKVSDWIKKNSKKDEE